MQWECIGHAHPDCSDNVKDTRSGVRWCDVTWVRHRPHQGGLLPGSRCLQVPDLKRSVWRCKSFKKLAEADSASQTCCDSPLPLSSKIFSLPSWLFWVCSPSLLGPLYRAAQGTVIYLFQSFRGFSFHPETVYRGKGVLSRQWSHVQPQLLCEPFCISCVFSCSWILSFVANGIWQILFDKKMWLDIS